MSEFMRGQISRAGEGTTAITLNDAVLETTTHRTEVSEPDGAAAEAFAAKQLNDIVGRVIDAVPE